MLMRSHAAGHSYALLLFLGIGVIRIILFQDHSFILQMPSIKTNNELLLSWNLASLRRREVLEAFRGRLRCVRGYSCSILAACPVVEPFCLLPGLHASLRAS